MHTARLREPYLIGEHHLIENVIFVEAHLCALTQRRYAEFGGDILVFPRMLCHLRHSTFTCREYPYKSPFPIDQPAWRTKDGDIPFLRPLRAIEFNCLCDFAAKTFSTTGDALHKTQPFQLASYPFVIYKRGNDAPRFVSTPKHTLFTWLSGWEDANSKPATGFGSALLKS